MTPASGNRSDLPLDAEFRSIVRDFTPQLYRQAYRMLGDSEEATEAVQEVLLSVYRSLDEFRGDCALATWIYKIALNTFFTCRRRQRNQPLPLIEPEDAQTLVDEDGDLEEEYNRKETRERLARCIARLSPRESAAITLFYMDGFGYKEIASIMGTSLSSVGLLIHRGREHLHFLLTGKKERAGKGIPR
jgi:RNA polymerase sigma-70 factor (ECF subfamily)